MKISRFKTTIRTRLARGTSVVRAFIWPIVMPARRYLLLNVARAQIGPDKREKTGQTA
jgi:hypothetical protein